MLEKTKMRQLWLCAALALNTQACASATTAPARQAPSVGPSELPPQQETRPTLPRKASESSRQPEVPPVALTQALAKANASFSKPSAANAPSQPPSAPEPTAVPGPNPIEGYQMLLSAEDRTEDDRERDALRHGLEILQFLNLSEGMRVADLGAGSGYNTELLARAVGTTGQVWGQNNAYILERFVKDSWPARLARPAMANVVRVDSELENPLPHDAVALDVVTLFFYYHDAISQGVDRDKMNHAIYAALRPGGVYVIADHRAPSGSGLQAAAALHRIDEAIVREEVEAAGFQFVGSTDFLRNSSDSLEAKSFEVGFDTDRFLLKFEKPTEPPAPGAEEEQRAENLESRLPD